MNKRQLKKNNKSRINMILSFIPFKVNGKPLFGSGYFIFEKPESSIAWFYLKDFPEWKFGIWLNEEGNGYDIFGQMVAQLDKFKPCASRLTSRDVQLFVDELYKIKDNHPDWTDYLETNQEYVNENMIIKRNNMLTYSALYSFIEDWNQNGYDKYHFQNVDSDIDTSCYLELVDGNRNGFEIIPRYSIHCMYDKSFLKNGTRQDVYLKSKDAFIKLINKMDEIYDPNIDDFMSDSYIFTDFGQELISKQQWVKDAVKYNRENKDHEKYLNNIFEYNREDYKIDSDEIKQIIVKKFLKTDYEGPICLKEEIKKEIDDYNVQYADMLIERLFRKPALAEKWLKEI